MKIPSIRLKDFSSATWCRNVLFMLLLLLIASAVCVYVIDPCTRYRRPKLYKEYFVDEGVQIPGILRNYDYKGIILGSSMCRNFALHDFKDAFGVDFIKASFSGGVAAEFGACMECAAENHGQSVQYLVLCMDPYSYTFGEASRTTQPDMAVFYDSGHCRDFRYWWNMTVWSKFMFKPFKSTFDRKYNLRKGNMDTMFSWQRDEYGAAIMVKLLPRLANFHTKAYDADAESVQKTLRNCILGKLKLFPNAKVHMFFPPYSIAFLGVLEEHGKLEAFLNVRKAMVEELLRHPEITVHDFQAAESVITNLDNYRDIIHFRSEINHWISLQLKEDTWHLTAENFIANQNHITQMTRDSMDLLREKGFFGQRP